MSRKLISIAVVAALLLAVTAVIVQLRPRRESEPKKSGPVPVVHLEGSAAPDLGPATLPLADPSAYAELNSSKTTALQDVRIVEGLVQNMQQLLKTAAVPPLGFNEEITRALTGRNPLELAFIPSTHAAINARGLLCDRWGTPFHFHPVANDRIDVRSAGPDKTLFTADDVVSASSPAVSGPVADPGA
ncbi:hypothetical protein CMV30_11045 [Nibricoccus aquaticus]|uniref:Type II secretion system protein GspG C-terminal domain-containing protein n=1 Tax=Nibricoccus aquaticus TaxID=2576891 RepID=A0A290QDW5_9BACT|nr:hypothetical protein [Nibricoccus aquaticus]ATC64446.1 hypothetical protein CMV30_11045 [Nibricoccus aquaticus]